MFDIMLGQFCCCQYFLLRERFVCTASLVKSALRRGSLGSDVTSKSGILKTTDTDQNHMK